MKKLFLAFALIFFVGAPFMNTVYAGTHAKVIVTGGEETKKDKKCKKGSSCCKVKATANNDKKECSGHGSKKCCSSGNVQPQTGALKPAPTPVLESKTEEPVK